jgi:hypothetical protein
MIDFGPEALDHAGSGEAANPLCNGIWRQMHAVAEGLPSDSSVSLENTENFAVNFLY